MVTRGGSRLKASRRSTVSCLARDVTLDGSRGVRRPARIRPPATSGRSVSDSQPCFAATGHALRAGGFRNLQGHLLVAARDPPGTDFSEAKPVVERP